MKKNNISKNFNFASSKNAINDIQNQYMQFAFQQKPIDEMIKNIQQKKINNVKPFKQIKQEPNIQKKTLNNQKVNIVLTHKIGVKNQKKQQVLSLKVEKKLKPEEKMELIPLNCLEVEQDIYEISMKDKPTQWQYNMFQEVGLKAQQIVEHPKVSFQFNEQNIKQGNVGNCYFICSLGALSKVNNLLNKRIPGYKKYDEKTNSYLVNMFESGKLVKFPVQNCFKNIYSKPVQNDISCLILEKAYAQLYGNFQIINMGHAIDSLRDLSGSQAEYIDLNELKFLKLKIAQAFQRNHPIVIASKSTVSNNSISAKHSYNVLDFKIKYQNLFLKLRDPRGWSNSTFKIPLQFNTENQNGVFWIDYQSLKTNFQVITICKPNVNNLYYFKTFSQKELNIKLSDGYAAIYFQLDQTSKVCISSHQKHKKFYDQKYHYEMIKIMICEVNQNGKFIRCIGTNFNLQQVCSLQLNLSSGYYIAVGSIKMNKKNISYQNQKLTISLYSQKKISNFNISKKYDIQRYLANYIEEHTAQFKETISKQGLIRYHGSLFGFMCIYYQNLSNKSVKEQLQYQTENIEITEKKVTLEKGETKIILNPIGSKNNGSHKCVFKSRTFYQQSK